MHSRAPYRPSASSSSPTRMPAERRASSSGADMHVGGVRETATDPQDVSNQSGDSFLLVRVHGSLCALPLGHVQEVLRPLPLQAVPGAPAFVCGVTVIRGGVMPVIDAAVLFRND